MIRSLLAAVALALVASTATAADQPLNSNYRTSGRAPFEPRFDGLGYHKTAKTPVLVGNGDGFFAIGPTYRETFGYGDGLGAICQGVARTGGFSRAAGADTACNTTCGNAECVGAFEAALADAGDILDCADATADACFCQTTGLDELAACGADWEAPALGLTRISLPSGVSLGHVALLAQDIGPDMDANGLDISADQTNNDGVELFGGLYGASGRPLVPSVDPAFKFCVSFAEIEDVSGADELWIGFRGIEPTNTTFNNYASYAVIGVASGNVTVETEDDGANAASTDTGIDVADTAGIDLCVKVSDSGAVTYTADGSVPSLAPAFNLDAGEPVIPFLWMLHDSDVAGEVVIDLWEVSFY